MFDCVTQLLTIQDCLPYEAAPPHITSMFTRPLKWLGITPRSTEHNIALPGTDELIVAEKDPYRC